MKKVTKKETFLFPVKEAAGLAKAAKREGVSKTALVRQAVRKLILSLV